VPATVRLEIAWLVLGTCILSKDYSLNLLFEPFCSPFVNIGRFDPEGKEKLKKIALWRENLILVQSVD